MNLLIINVHSFIIIDQNLITISLFILATFFHYLAINKTCKNFKSDKIIVSLGLFY